MSRELALRPANISDAFQFVAIMNDQYAHKRTPEYFYWQYIHPYEQTVLMCAFDADRMCGTFGLKKRKLNNGVIVGQAIDMLIIPAWRKKGLFHRLADRALQYFNKELDVLCVLANAAGNHAVQRTLGWESIGTIKTLFLRKSGSLSSKLSVDESRESVDARFRFDRDEAYRQWRFDKHPEYSYKAVGIENILSWTKIFIDPVTRTKYGDIVDIRASCGPPKALHDSLRVACGHLQLQGVEFITTWAMPGTLLRRVAEAIGFEERKQERYFCVKVLNPSCKYLTDFSKWDIVQADAEIY